MSFTPKIREYLEDKIGKDYVDAFEIWALVGMRGTKRKCSDSFVESWNFAHPSSPIKQSLNAFDAVDRMIAVWKERFG